jgi:hypothetical protein
MAREAKLQLTMEMRYWQHLAMQQPSCGTMESILYHLTTQDCHLYCHCLPLHPHIHHPSLFPAWQTGNQSAREAHLQVKASELHLWRSLMARLMALLWKSLKALTEPG